MGSNSVNPLTWNVAIADPATGWPTPEFQRKWLQQGTQNASAGTVTSVAVTVSAPWVASVNNPATKVSIALGIANQSANEVYAGPVTGSAAQPAFRALVGADLPAATTLVRGGVRPDGTTITIVGDVISSVGGGGGGYPAGTPPTVVQVASGVGGGNSATFGAAPTNGNLLVAMCFNPSSAAAGSGWALQADNSGGTDYGLILTKIAGAGESTTQSPTSSVGGTGCLVIWELNGQNGSAPFAAGVTETEATGTSCTPVNLPNCTNCIGLAAVSGVNGGGDTITTALNVGTQDVLSNTSAERILVAGHTDFSKTPLVGILASFNNSIGSKGATCLITS